jgi:Glycosyltransferase family 87
MVDVRYSDETATTPGEANLGAMDSIRPRSPWIDSRSFVVVVVGCGLLLRLLVALAAARYAFVGDHVGNLTWGMAAADHGLTRIYDLQAADLPAVTGAKFEADGTRITGLLQPSRIGLPNHPPLTIVLYWVQAETLRILVHKPVLNSSASRLVVACIQVVFDGAFALAVGFLAMALFGTGALRAAAALAWLFPPLVLNSSFWGQVDVLFLVPAVATVALMLRHRWFSAGAAMGIALLVKPQAVLFAPVVLFAAFGTTTQEGRLSVRGAVAALTRVALAAFLTVSVVAMPWTLTSGLDWLNRCYTENIVYAYPLTTLKAFNFWYLDALRLDGLPSIILDSHARVLGITKDMWGRALLATTLIAIACLVWRRYRGSAEGVVVFSGLWLWSTFIWPTRVHERYIVYCMPFLIALAVGRKCWRAPVLALLVLGCAEHTWNLWTRGMPAGSLITKGMIRERYRRDLEDYERLGAASSSQPKPTIRDARRQVIREAVARRADYLERRRPVRHAELGITLLSLVAYGGGLWCGLGPIRAQRAPPSGQVAG